MEHAELLYQFDLTIDIIWVCLLRSVWVILMMVGTYEGSGESIGWIIYNKVVYLICPGALRLTSLPRPLEKRGSENRVLIVSHRAVITFKSWKDAGGFEECQLRHGSMTWREAFSAWLVTLLPNNLVHGIWDFLLHFHFCKTQLTPVSQILRFSKGHKQLRNECS